MKKLFFIAFLFYCLGSWGQGGIIPPTGVNFKTIQAPIFKYYTTDSTFWASMGSSLGWYKMFRCWKVMQADSVVTNIYEGDTLNISKYKLIADSILNQGYATNWRLQHKIDSLGVDVRDTISLYRKIADHDSLSMLDEKDYSSLTNKPNLSIYRQLNNHDSLSTLQEKNYSSLDCKPDLSIYRTLSNHDSLTNLDEKSYNSLTDKPNLALYRLLTNHDSLSTLDEKQHASLTNILGRGQYHVSQSERDSILTALQKKDSISYVTPFQLIQSLPTGFELEVVTAGLTQISLPFTLSNRTLVWYNGAIISKNLWAGVNTQSITLFIATKEKDLLKIQNQ